MGVGTAQLGHAMREFCGRFKEVQEQHGKESVAFISTGQIVTEDGLGALAKFVWDEAWGWQHAAVYGNSGGVIQTEFALMSPYTYQILKSRM